MCPLYQWQCLNCGKIEEQIQPFKNDPPYCCGKFMERQISVVNHTFGWRFSEASHIPGNKDELVRNV